MNKYDYVKVLLYAYPKLDALAEAVECGVEVKALLSFRGRESALALAEKIAEEIVTAKKLSLLKEALKKALSACSERELFLLEYKYFRRKELLKGRYAGYSPECSQRHYFRLQNALLEKMAALCAGLGLTQDWFFEEFGDFAPFMRVYRALAEGRERTVVYKRKQKAICFRQNSDSCGGDFLPRKRKAAIAASATAATQTIAICIPESPFSGTGVGSSFVSPEEGVR